MAEKNSLWKNIRNKAAKNRRTGATPKKPTAEMLRQEAKIKAKKADGGPVNTLEGDLISKVIMNRNRDKDFVQRAYAVGEYPESNMFNVFDKEKFGEKNSHLMEWGEDDSGQTWMYPSVMNPKDEAIKVPRQYADYISSTGYKKATGMQYDKGGLFVGYAKGGKYLTADGIAHKVYRGADGDIMVNHPKNDYGKWDTLNLTDKSNANTIAEGVASVRKWHRENPSYAQGGYTNPYMYYSGGPMQYEVGGKVWKNIAAGLYGAGEGILDTITMGATDQLTDRGFDYLTKVGNKNIDLNNPDDVKFLKTQQQVKGYSNTAGAIGTAVVTGNVQGAITQGTKGLNTAFQASDWASDDFKKWSQGVSGVAGLAAGFAGGLNSDSFTAAQKAGTGVAGFGQKAGKMGSFGNQAMGMIGGNQQPLWQQGEARQDYLNSPNYLAMKDRQNQEYVNQGLSFSNGGNVNNNSLNLQNSMRNRYNSYRKKSKGGTFHQYGINQIPDSAGLHHQNAYGGVPIGQDAMAEGGEYVLDDNYVVSDQVDGMNTQTDEFGNTMAENLKTRLNKYTLRDLNSKNKGDLRRPNDSFAQNTIDQIKQQAMMETEMARAEAQAQEEQNMAMRDAAVQYAAAGGKLNKDITKIVEEEYAAAYGGQINPKRYKGLNMPYSGGGKLPKEVLRARAESHMSPQEADAYVKQYGEGGGIHIKESKKGTFTAAATKHGKSVQEFAKQVLANKDNYSSKMVQKANFARNAASWKHADGGYVYKPMVQPMLAEGGPLYGDPGSPYTYAMGGSDDDIKNDRSYKVRRNMFDKIVSVEKYTDEDGSKWKIKNKYNPDTKENIKKYWVDGKFSGRFTNQDEPEYMPVKERIEFNNQPSVTYGQGGPMVSNVSQPFNGPSAQNRGGMMVEYGRGGMMYDGGDLFDLPGMADMSASEYNNVNTYLNNLNTLNVIDNQGNTSSILGRPRNSNTSQPKQLENTTDLIGPVDHSFHMPTAPDTIEDLPEGLIEPIQSIKSKPYNFSTNNSIPEMGIKGGPSLEYPFGVEPSLEPMPGLSKDATYLSPYQKYLVNNYPEGLNNLNYDSSGEYTRYITPSANKNSATTDSTTPWSEEPWYSKAARYSQALPGVAATITGLMNKKRKLTPERISPEQVNLERSRITTKEEGRRALDSGLKTVRGSSSNTGQLAGNTRDMILNYNKNMGANIAKSYETEENANAQLRQQAALTNQQYGNAFKQMNEEMFQNAQTQALAGFQDTTGKLAGAAGEERKQYLQEWIAKNKLKTRDFVQGPDGSYYYEGPDGKLVKVS